MSTATLPAPTAAPPSTRRPRLIHIVKLNPDGTPGDEALCGYLWDHLYPKGAPAHLPRCQECVDEAVRRATRGAA